MERKEVLRIVDVSRCMKFQVLYATYDSKVVQLRTRVYHHQALESVCADRRSSDHDSRQTY